MYPLFSSNKRSLARRKIDEALKLLNDADSLISLNKESVQEKAESFIKDDNWQVRNIGVKVLGKAGESRHGELLASLLKDKKQVGFIRRNAARSIRAITAVSPEAEEALIEGIDDNYWEVRVESVKTLGTLYAGNEKIAKALLNRYLGDNYEPQLNSSKPDRIKTKEKNFEVREAIAESLGNFLKIREAVKALKCLLEDDNWMVRAAALRSLSGLAEKQEDFRKIIERMDLTCESFRPVFPLKEIYSDMFGKKKDK